MLHRAIPVPQHHPRPPRKTIAANTASVRIRTAIHVRAALSSGNGWWKLLLVLRFTPTRINRANGKEGRLLAQVQLLSPNPCSSRTPGRAPSAVCESASRYRSRYCSTAKRPASTLARAGAGGRSSILSRCCASDHDDSSGSMLRMCAAVFWMRAPEALIAAIASSPPPAQVET